MHCTKVLSTFTSTTTKRMLKKVSAPALLTRRISTNDRTQRNGFQFFGPSDGFSSHHWADFKRSCGEKSRKLGRDICNFPRSGQDLFNGSAFTSHVLGFLLSAFK